MSSLTFRFFASVISRKRLTAWRATGATRTDCSRGRGASSLRSETSIRSSRSTSSSPISTSVDSSGAPPRNRWSKNRKKLRG